MNYTDSHPNNYPLWWYGGGDSDKTHVAASVAYNTDATSNPNQEFDWNRVLTARSAFHELSGSSSAYVPSAHTNAYSDTGIGLTRSGVRILHMSITLISGFPLISLFRY